MLSSATEAEKQKQKVILSLTDKLIDRLPWQRGSGTCHLLVWVGGWGARSSPRGRLPCAGHPQLHRDLDGLTMADSQVWTTSDHEATASRLPCATQPQLRCNLGGDHGGQ